MEISDLCHCHSPDSNGCVQGVQWNVLREVEPATWDLTVDEEISVK